MHNLMLDQQWEIVKLSHHKNFYTEILSGEEEQWAKPTTKEQVTPATGWTMSWAAPSA